MNGKSREAGTEPPGQWCRQDLKPQSHHLVLVLLWLHKIPTSLWASLVLLKPREEITAVMMKVMIVINVHKVSLHYTIITNMRGRGLFKRAMEKILLMNLKNIIENKNEELPMSVASLLGVQRQSKVLLHFSH